MKIKPRYTTSFLCFLYFLFPPIFVDQGTTITDDLGTVHVLGSPPQRIISLAPNITEILFALGLEKRIVGVTRFCNYPKEAQAKNRIGGMVDPDLEKIIDLRPDLIIAFRGNPLRSIQRLRALDQPVFVLESGITLASVFSLIQRIGLVTRRERAAEDLVVVLNRGLEKLRDRLKNVKIRPKVFINLHGKGLWTCGKNSFMNDLVREAKGRNIAGEVPRAWFNFNREELIHRNPDHIVVLAKGEEDFFRVKTWFAKDAHLESIQAVKNDRIFYLNEDLVTRHGPRIFEALDQLARMLHPSSFKEDR